MKAVLISIQPKWCELIACGKKTVEVRKTVPKLETPFKVYIYCTKEKTRIEHSCIPTAYENLILNKNIDRDCQVHFYNGIPKNELCTILNGKVIGEFVCDFIEPVSANNRYCISKLSCVPLPDLYNYAGVKGLEGLNGWHISDLKIYDTPKELCEFEKSWYDTNGNWHDIRPCECDKYCKHEYFDYSENTIACDIDFDGDNCPYTKITRPPQSWCYVEGRADNATDQEN